MHTVSRNNNIFKKSLTPEFNHVTVLAMCIILIYFILFTEYHTTFQQYDKNNDNTIDCEELGDCMRCCGSNPTMSELKAMIDSVDDNSKLTWQSKRERPKDSHHQC